MLANIMKEIRIFQKQWLKILIIIIVWSLLFLTLGYIEYMIMLLPVLLVMAVETDESIMTTTNQKQSVCANMLSLVILCLFSFVVEFFVIFLVTMLKNYSFMDLQWVLVYMISYIPVLFTILSVIGFLKSFSCYRMLLCLLGVLIVLLTIDYTFTHFLFSEYVRYHLSVYFSDCSHTIFLYAIPIPFVAATWLLQQNRKKSIQ